MNKENTKKQDRQINKENTLFGIDDEMSLQSVHFAPEENHLLKEKRNNG